VVVVLALLPPAMALVVTNDLILVIAGSVWLLAAILYYSRVRTKPALWIFALLPIAFGPFVYGLLIMIGVLLGQG
jgi:hypothetical protein